MNPLRFFRSSAFRLTILYMTLFGASVAALLVFIYFTTIQEMEAQAKESINIQLADLGRKFIIGGTQETITAIEHLVATDKDHSSMYMLINRNWVIQAGNLDRWPGGSPTKREWIHFYTHASPDEPDKLRPVLIKEDSENDYIPQNGEPQVLAINSSLPEGYILLVGQRLDQIARVEQIYTRVLQISIALTVILGIAGAWVLTYRIHRRLESINHSCQRVMQGEMNHQVPIFGTGDEFDHLATNFNAMLGRINELLTGVREIASNVAHDLRTPLSRLRNRLERSAAANKSREELQEDLRATIAEVDGLVATFNAILRISQAEKGAGVEQFQDFNLSATVSNIVEFYSSLADEKQIQMMPDIEKDIFLRGDRHLIEQALANLLDNGIKYSPTDSAIRVRLEKNNAIRLTIDDQGPGIPEALYQKVTEKFYRLETSRSTPGNGLGLSLAHAAIRLHGGTITFGDNKPGLRVEITMPTVMKTT